jgi:hypothetical protein
MAGSYVVAVEGLSGLESLEDLPDNILLAARRAVNKTADRSRARSAREIRNQVNFPASYVSGQRGRLKIAKKASGRDLEAIIRGRERPTSLAQFVTAGKLGGKGGVSVAVKPGVTKRMPRAFLIKLRAGNASIDTRFNLGLAIRLRPGESIRNKSSFVRLQQNLYLLYGPSVNQVFEAVAGDEAPNASNFLEQEFLRLLDL